MRARRLRSRPVALRPARRDRLPMVAHHPVVHPAVPMDRQEAGPLAQAGLVVQADHLVGPMDVIQ